MFLTVFSAFTSSVNGDGVSVSQSQRSAYEHTDSMRVCTCTCSGTTVPGGHALRLTMCASTRACTRRTFGFYRPARYCQMGNRRPTMMYVLLETAVPLTLIVRSGVIRGRSTIIDELVVFVPKSVLDALALWACDLIPSCSRRQYSATTGGFALN